MSGPSRFSSLNSFFRSKTPNPPPPPPKDRDRRDARDNQSLYAQSSFSQSTRSFTIPRSTSPAPTTQTAGSSVYNLNGPSSSQLNLSQFGGGGGIRLVGQGQSSAPSSFKRGVARIAGGLKRPKSRANLLQDPTPPKDEGDDGSISTPWNFQVRQPPSPFVSTSSFAYCSIIYTWTRASTGYRRPGPKRCSKPDIPRRRSARCTTPDGQGPLPPPRPCAPPRPRPPRTV
mgnify:CR=1 FL=1